MSSAQPHSPRIVIHIGPVREQDPSHRARLDAVVTTPLRVVAAPPLRPEFVHAMRQLDRLPPQVSADVL